MTPTDIGPVVNSDLLRTALTAIDTAVPLRTEGRKTGHTERWIICRLLSTLDKERGLRFPLSVRHGDRPDFVVTQDSFEVGVEATEAISEQYAAYSALAEREFPDVLLEPGHFKWGSPKRSPDEMRELLRRGRLTAPPWAGDRPEQEWAQYMDSIVRIKLAKLQRPGFTKHGENWLAIYDNLALPNVHLQRASHKLVPLLVDTWAQSPAFHRVFIERGPVILELRSQGSAHLVLEDLWSLLSGR